MRLFLIMAILAEFATPIKAETYTKTELITAKKNYLGMCEQYGRMAKDIASDRDRSMSAAYVRDQYARLSKPNIPLDTMIEKIFTGKDYVGFRPAALKTKIFNQCMNGEWDKYTEYIYENQDLYNQAKGLKQPVSSSGTQVDKVVKEVKTLVKTQGVRIGMSQSEVVASIWGRPQKINKTTSMTGTTEQWIYKNGNYLYFQDGILTTVQN